MPCAKLQHSDSPKWFVARVDHAEKHVLTAFAIVVVIKQVAAMHFTKLKLRNFRNFDGEFEILFLPGHTIVLGANGAGKSNIPLGIGFVLAADKKLLGIEREQDFINATHRSAALGKLRLKTCPI